MTSAPLRVIHTVPALFGPSGVLGGAERYVLELARHMAQQVPTRLVTFGETDRQESDGNLEIRVLGNPWLVRGERFNPFSLKLLRELRWGSVVHCHQQHILASSVAALYARLTGRRVFVTDLGGGGWDISAYVSTDRWYHAHLHISHYSQQVFGHAHDARARVISGGVDADRFSPEPSTTRSGEVLFVGRLLPHKGVNYLIEGIPPQVPLTVLGDSSDAGYFDDLTRLAAGKPVTFRQGASDAELVAAYRRALCIVLPSVYRTVYDDESRVPELLGQTLLEGMACETPGLATDVASLPEVVEDGVSGFVVPPNDPAALGEKIRWLTDHPEQTRRMGVAARKRVLERFTWPKVVERCLESYRE